MWLVPGLGNLDLSEKHALPRVSDESCEFLVLLFLSQPFLTALVAVANADRGLLFLLSWVS